MATRLIFLGTGGGRFVTIDQLRATGGLYLIDGDNRIHIDPGPGALLKLYKYKIRPADTNAILVSHCHPDHYIDVEILVEAMTNGCNIKRGLLLASKSILKGIPDHGPAVSNYHQSVVGKLVVATPGKTLNLGRTVIEVIPAFHSDFSGVGFRFRTENGVIVYGSDTKPSEALYKSYSRARILILSVTTPLCIRIPFHLNTEDAADIVEACKPELCIISHFGVNMLKNNVSKQARWIAQKSGIRTVAAKDGLSLNLKKTIGIGK